MKLPSKSQLANSLIKKKPRVKTQSNCHHNSNHKPSLLIPSISLHFNSLAFLSKARPSQSMEENKGTAGYHHPHPPSSQQHRPPPSTTELISSAKLIAGAAKSAFAHESDKIDKGRVAGAAADLLGAAKSYGRLEEKSYGKYFDKAESYLYNYHSSHYSAAGGQAGHGQVQHQGAVPPSASYQQGVQDGGGQGHFGGGGGGGGGGAGAGGYGDYIKMAQEFLKKH